MKNITSLASLYKRDTKGKVRIWTIEWGSNSDTDAGFRTIAGLLDGQKVTSEWNKTIAKNEGKVNYKSQNNKQNLKHRLNGLKKQIKNILRIKQT